MKPKYEKAVPREYEKRKKKRGDLKHKEVRNERKTEST